MVTTVSAISSYNCQCARPAWRWRLPITHAWRNALRHLARCFARPESEAEADARQSVFRSILRTHDNLISRLCFSYSRTNEEFEDLRQDAYINIWQGLAGFRGESEMKTWLYRVTLNTCVTSLRKHKKSDVSIELSEVLETPDEDTDYLMNIAALHEAIATLPALDKAIILMWLDEMSYDEIAGVMGMGRNTVATRLRRAKNKLKANM